MIDNRWVNYKGEKTSLSAVAQGLLGCQYTVSGPLYWMFEGETLEERRTRLESQEWISV